MKVLHICNNFISSTVHQKMAQASRSLGIRNTVFAPVVTLEGRVSPVEDEYARACVNSLDRFFFYHKQKKTYNCLRQTIDISKYQCIHTHCVFTDGNVAMRLKQEVGIPYLVTINNTDLNHFFKLRILLRKRGLQILEQASKIVFIAEPYQNAVFDQYIPENLKQELMSKTVVIPFGIDDFWFEQKQETPKIFSKNRPLRLFYAGDINKNKNIQLTVNAIKILSEKGIDAELLLAGNIQDKGLFEQLLSERFVSYAGILNREELLKHYRNSDIFVMPSHTDTFGLVYAEAMSQATPIVYTKNQGFDKQFPDGTVGYAVSDRDPQELAARILDILDHYSELSRNCLQLLDKFNWHKIAEQYRTIYNQIGREQI